MSEDEISSILVDIRKKGHNARACHNMKQHSCHLKNVDIHALELSELATVDRDSDIGIAENNGRQVCLAYSNLFNRQYAEVKPAAICRTILVQGEAAVGKTMLCMSIVEDWATGKLFQEFQIVLLLPLSSRNVASASSLSELLNMLYTDFNEDNCTKVASYLKKNKEHDVLIIADGLEDLQASQCQIGSFLHSLLFSNDVIPTSSSTVLITSRPGCSQLHILQSVDRFITLTGFDKKAIESVIQAEFEGDLKRIRYLTVQLNDNPLVASMCSTPLNLAILCNLCRSNDVNPLPNTMTKLYAKLIRTLAAASSKSSDLHKSISLSSHHDLPEELQQSWCHLCELAFRNIEKSYDTFSHSDESLELKKISYFGLIKPQPESGDTLSFSFLHPCFEEYLAALYLATKPQEAQFRFMRELSTECDSKAVIAFWHFFISNYVRVVVNVNPDIIIQVLKVISPRLFSTKREYFRDLCHYSFEAKHHVVNHQVIKALSTVDNEALSFHSRNVHDCNAMIYVIGNIMQECKVEINFQDCHLKPEHINSLANALHEKSSIVQVRGLNLSNTKLNNSLTVDSFNRIAASLKSLKVLILRNCDIGTNLDIQAVLSALTDASCQTLTRLDLSLNPISVSFLQILQRHIESFATFEGLQNLGLKGSLKKDVSISFLANFSDTLSSRCKCLRRLDLSDNNLGEPGNPDLSKVISQLLSLGRDFNLCLNEEYMSEVHDEFICVMEESIKKKGTINHTMAHGVIVGPGRSGKNTLMNRLMGNGPPEPDSISPSTGVLENIVKVEVKKLCTVATAVSNLEWKKLKYDEEALELIMTTARYHSATTTVPKPISVKYIVKEHDKSSTDVPSVKSALPYIALAGSKQQKKHKIVKFFKKLKRFRTGKSSQGCASKDEEKKKDAVLYKPDIEPVDIFKQALELQGMDALREHLESSWSLYLTNTGGQIEFQEHLPLLVCGPSIFFVTFPLHYDLEKPYDVCYEYPDGRVETYKSPATLLEELLQTLATINASNFNSGQKRDSEAAIKPKIFFVGTHRDHLQADTAEETIERKDKLLQTYIRQTSLIDQELIHFAQYPKQLMFTVNNLSNDDKQFQKIRTAVQRTVEGKEFTIECPSSWLILSLILRAKHKSDQVLSFDKCFSIAQECGIADRKELNQALSFIHSRLGLVRYFNTEDLNTLVVIDPQILFDKITDLIVNTFTSDNVSVKVKIKEMENFHQRGIIPVAVMQEISDNSSSDSKLPFIWLTKLLNYLRVAALFTDSDGDKYFFPSALCHAPELHFNEPLPSDSRPPLLVGFKSGFCPRGIPGALIKYLMTNEMKSKRSWDIIPNKIFKNQVSFAIQAHRIITLRILPTHLEICYESETDSVGEASAEVDSKVYELTKKTCEMAYIQIKKGMSTVTNECDYFFGFYCTLTSCQAHKHPAQIEWDGKTPFQLKLCKVANKRGSLPKGHEIWNLRRKPKPGSYSQCSC